MVWLIIRETPGLWVVSSYGRGMRESTNGGSGRRMSNPENLLYDRVTVEGRDYSRLVGNPAVGNSGPEYCSVVRQLATRRRFVPSRTSR
jgi:hypothetical protein